jgi:hypothetical protein
MAWTPFSAEAVRLHTELIKLNKRGATSEALNLIVAALEVAHRQGPSNMSYEEIDRQAVENEKRTA